MADDTGNAVCCETCGRTFDGREELVRHVRRVGLVE